MAAATCECRVALSEVAAWADQPEWTVSAVADEAKRLHVKVVDDWAGRPAVKVEDARRLREHLVTLPRVSPMVTRGAVADQASAYGVPTVWDRRAGQWVDAIERPGVA